MAAAFEFVEVGVRLGFCVQPVHLLGDLQRHGVVVAAGDEEQRATVGQLGVDLGRD
jgi:hypothetical protein